MLPNRVWPDFRAGWVVHVDDDLVVIDKPAGVPSQAAQAGIADDIVSRLARYIAAGGLPDGPSGGAYLGVHQRLDMDTSGLLVYARRREANGSLAAQFEGRRVKKVYVAAVTGWPAKRASATLCDRLVPGPNGRVVVGGGPNAKEAVTRVRVLARCGERSLLELELETGRTHQARAQLAHAGAPIAGDTLYDGAVAARLMLHASALELVHPATGQPVRYAAPPPGELEAWLASGELGPAVYDDQAALARALAHAVERRYGLGRSEGARRTTAFRLVNEEGDALPRLAVDVYGGWLVAQLYGDDGPWADEDRQARVFDALHTLGFDGVYLKVRPKQANLLVDTRQERLAPQRPVRGVPAPEDMMIHEEGALLRVRLGDGLSTGVFLDQRGNRRRVREMASGLRVANLFAYTCAFSVAAALGGARSTVSVDASLGALERGRDNFADNGLLDGVDAAGRFKFVGDDVFAWIGRASGKGERFDLVVLDPPSYSSTKRGRFVADTDYANLAASALTLLAPSGQLLASTNHRGISKARLRRMLFDAGRSAGRDVAQVKDLPEGSDFPVPPGGHPAMKSALLRLA